MAEWPALTPIRIIPGWWPDAEGYGNGLAYFDGTLWVGTRVFYDQAPTPTLTYYAMDGRTRTIQLPRQRFGGFVKRGAGLEPYVGCGGYQSGQGSCSGPTMALMDGTVLISHEWPGLPGENLENWNLRAPREPNYWPIGHIDSWVSWEPRVVNGVLEGRWASDRVLSGGLVLPEGICYWCRMGVGETDYNNQLYTFTTDEKTYKYVYDKNTYQLIDWTEVQLGRIGGQEIDNLGRVYLCETNAWKSGQYQVDCAVRVYG